MTCPYLQLNGFCGMTGGESFAPPDVRPVVRGKWKRVSPFDHYDFRCVCANCEKYWIDADEKYDFNYCPNCGAKMEGSDG